MKILFTAFLLSCVHVFAQDTLKTGHWHYLNRYDLSTYLFTLFDQKTSDYVFEGNELDVNLVSYHAKRQEVGISSGAFFISRKNSYYPTARYFYFPLSLSYTLYSKRGNAYGKLIVSKPLLSYEDSKQMDLGTFWLGYNYVMSPEYFTPFLVRKRIYGMCQLKYGYRFKEHVGLSAGMMTCLYETNVMKFNLAWRLVLGIEFRL